MRVVIGIVAAVAAVGLPPAATAAWLLVGIVAGGLAGAWTWLTAPSAAPVGGSLTSSPVRAGPVDVAVRTGLLAAAAGIALGATALALGPATPVVISTVTAALALWMWAGGRR